LLDKGFFGAADLCLDLYDGYRFILAEEHQVDGARSKVDYRGSIGEGSVLVEAKSPSVMKVLGESLPLHGFQLKWAPNQPLSPKILQKVSMRVLRYNTYFDDSCNIGRSISGSEGDGMVVLDMPQPLGRLSSCQNGWNHFSRLFANFQYGRFLRTVSSLSRSYFVCSNRRCR
jgi:hypothetical protein